MDGPPDVATVVAGMTSDSESHRKLAAFHLQSLLADESFADAFAQGDGMRVLKRAIVQENGNTLAYAMGSLTRLLNYDLGWDDVGSDVVSRAVEIVVSRPLINVLRNALHLLVLVVSRPLDESPRTPHSGHEPSTRSFGFKVLKPMLDDHPEFLDCLVDKLSSADHALSAHALQLINSLLRDSIVNGGEEDWPRFLRRVQELGIIDGVEILIRGEIVHELQGPIMQFQRLYILLLKRWRGVAVDMANPEHRKALTRIDTLSFPPGHRRRASSASRLDKQLSGETPGAESQRWQRLGFTSENPSADFERAGFLGLMDLMAFARENTDAYQKCLLEQSVQQSDQRCPLAKASLAVTLMLYQHFDVDHQDAMSVHEDVTDLEWTLQPLILKWDRMHAAALNAFLRLWTAAGARTNEFEKIESLVTILITRIIGGAKRKSSVEEVEKQMGEATLVVVRKWQLEDLDQVFENAWGSDLRNVRSRLHTEAVQFMQEQRIRCLLQGAWFRSASANGSQADGRPSSSGQTLDSTWRFVRLSISRRHLHHASFAKKQEANPAVGDMPQRIDVNDISSVVSNVTAGSPEMSKSGPTQKTKQLVDSTLLGGDSVTHLTIYGSSRRRAAEDREEAALLELQTTSPILASEWLDGLLMLLNQQPITADTHKAIDIIENWSLKVRMLNLEWEDVDWERAGEGDEARAVTVPSREGLDNDYWYDMGEG